MGESRQLTDCYASLEVAYKNWSIPSYSTYDNKEELLDLMKLSI